MTDGQRVSFTITIFPAAIVISCLLMVCTCAGTSGTPDLLPDDNLTAGYGIVNGTTGTGAAVEYIGQQLIVRFAPDTYANPDLFMNISASVHLGINATVLYDFRDDGLPGMQLVGLPANVSIGSALAYYENSSSVSYAQPNYVLKADPGPVPAAVREEHNSLMGALPVTPNDPYYTQQWYLRKIDAPGAWEMTTGSENVKIALFDDGVDINHQDLIGNLDTVNGARSYNGVHGTFCAGILAAEGNNARGITGVLWHAEVLPVVVFTGDESYLDVASEIRYFSAAPRMGYTIISGSYGGPGYSAAERDAIASSNALMIFAAGNSGQNNDVSPVYPASYNLDNIISVAASDQNDNLALFTHGGGSNFGRISVDLAAPGVGMFSTIPGGAYTLGGEGTSFSTPIVAGVAGLIRARHPELSNARIKDAILANVDKSDRLNGVVVSGGRVNASRALLSLEPSAPDLPPVANFTADPLSGTVPLEVRFSDTSSNTPTSWSWDFGDGGSSNLQNPVHTYTIPGTYNVTLRASNAKGWSSPFERPGLVTALPVSPAGTHTVRLWQGWNFVSTPRHRTAGTNTVGSLFGTVDFDHHSVLTYNSQAKLWRQMGAGDEILPLEGVWVYAKYPVNITLDLDPGQSGKSSKQLWQGWNAIGTPASYQIPAAGGLAPLGSNWSYLIGFDAETHTPDTAIIRGSTNPLYRDSRLMDPYSGFWLLMNTDGILESL
jgi:thermitase